VPERPSYRRVLVLARSLGLTAGQLREQIAAGTPPWAQIYGGPDWEFEELPTGHWPMLSMPDELSALLDRLAAARVP
jgi:hypothetical protein